MSIKQELVMMAQTAYKEKLFAQTSGNLSIYVPETKRIYITPSSYPYEHMQAEDIVAITLDGEVVEGSRKPSSEWRMHAAIYHSIEKVRAIVHTHSPYATSFAITHTPIPAVLYEILFFLGEDIPVAEGAIPGTEAVGTNAVKVLQNRNACLMANHGALAIGSTLNEAYMRAVYLEDAAKAYSLALQNGQPKPIPEKDVKSILG